MEKQLYFFAVLFLFVASSTKSQILDYSEKDWPSLCSTGLRQSPIDFASSINYNVTSNYINIVSVNYSNISNTSFVLLHENKYFLNVSNYNNSIVVSKNGFVYKYNLADVHFHAAAEHTINGQFFDFEMHLVHAKDQSVFNSSYPNITDPDAQNAYLVLGTLFKANNSVSSNNSLIQSFNLADRSNVTNLDLTSIANVNRPFYHYLGSLTTPACSEFVNWVLFNDIQTISTAQFKEINNWVHQTYPNGDGRSTKPLNNRIIYSVPGNLANTVITTPVTKLSSHFVKVTSVFGLIFSLILFI